MITVTDNEAGQRLDKLLAKYLDKAPKSFLYKMLRKKNITLNGKKAQGSEKTARGDEIKLFLSDETIDSFSSEVKAEKTGTALAVIYEDDQIVLVNKPAGMLSQKAKPEDVSLVEHLIGHLLENGSLAPGDLKSFRPSICNRLDRNTSGIVAAGKTLGALQGMSEVFRDRSICKEYLALVWGEINTPSRIDGYLVKDEKQNQVFVSTEEVPEAVRIATEYKPVCRGNGVTLLMVHLITGRSHQIRAHLASIGHPILGDSKYGDRKKNLDLRQKMGLDHQLLHSFRLAMPDKMPAPLEYLEGKVFFADPPDEFIKIAENFKIKMSTEVYKNKSL